MITPPKLIVNTAYVTDNKSNKVEVSDTLQIGSFYHVEISNKREHRGPVRCCSKYLGDNRWSECYTTLAYAIMYVRDTDDFAVSNPRWTLKVLRPVTPQELEQAQPRR